jgi:hypothetical protein
MLLLGLVATGWLVAVGATLLGARASSSEAIDELERARRAMARGEFERAERALVRAEEGLGDAKGSLGAPWMAPLRLLPVAGRQVESAQALSGAGRDAARVALDALFSVRAGLESGVGPGPGRASFLRDVADVARSSRARLVALDLGPDRGLLGPLADARERLEGELLASVGDLERASLVSAGLASVLDGPRTYLVLASNNAEMRAGSGMFLMAGLLSAEDGRFQVGELVSTHELTLPGSGVAVEPDVASIWGWTHPEREWRSLGATPRFDATAEHAVRMAREAFGVEPDGVLSVDPVAFEALLRVVGPVEAAGKRLRAANVRQELLHDQYESVPDSEAGQTVRRDRLGALAVEALGRLDDERWRLNDLADAFRGLGGGRHVLAWSRHDTERRAWTAARLDGRMSDRSLAVSLVNRGGNKLDPFLGVSVDVDLREAPDGVAVTLEITLENRTPDGEVRYVAGPHPTSGLVAGEYGGVLTVHVPRVAVDLEIYGGTPALAGNDGGSTMAGAWVRLPRGEALRLSARFTVPCDVLPLVVEPSARVPSIRWVAGGDRWIDDERRSIGLEGAVCPA